MTGKNASDYREEIATGLEAYGAESITVRSPAVVGTQASRIKATFDGTPDMAESVALQIDSLVLEDMDVTQYPGGETAVEAEYQVRKGGSSGSNPGGSASKTGSQAPPNPKIPDHPFTRCSFVQPEAQDNPVGEQYAPPPHAEGGTRIDVAGDYEGLPRQAEVEAWPVRRWAGATTNESEVPAIIVLRYVPAPDGCYHEDTMSWWAGYVRACPNPADQHSCKEFVENMHEYITSHMAREGTVVQRTYGADDSGWIGWDSLSRGAFDMDNREAADLTEAMAEAVAAEWREHGW